MLPLRKSKNTGRGEFIRRHCAAWTRLSEGRLPLKRIQIGCPMSKSTTDEHNLQLLYLPAGCYRRAFAAHNGTSLSEHL
jgi:hypothetical protein